MPKMILCFFCALSLQAYAGDGAETRALNVLIAKIEGARLYQARFKIECLSFTKEKETRSHFDFKVYENHQGKSCRGEAGIAPIVDRFRVLKKTNKILLYRVAEDQFLPLGDVMQGTLNFSCSCWVFCDSSAAKFSLESLSAATLPWRLTSKDSGFA